MPEQLYRRKMSLYSELNYSNNFLLFELLTFVAVVVVVVVVVAAVVVISTW